MNGYLLDSSTVIAYTKGKKEVVNFIDEIDNVEIASSYIVMCELAEGLERVNDRKSEEIIIGYLESLGKLYGIDAKTAMVFGKIRFDLKREGQIIEDLDILIASTCIANDLTLLTLNLRHFKRIEGLKVLEPVKYLN